MIDHGISPLPGAPADAALHPVGLPPSRRRFLQCMAAIAVSASATGLLDASVGVVGGVLAAFDAVMLGRPVPSPALAASAHLLRTAVDELQQQGFPFDLRQHSLVQLPGRPEVLGMLLHDTHIPPFRDGADLALTIYLEQPQRSSLQYVIGRSQDDGLAIHSTILHVRGERVEERLWLPRDEPAPAARQAGLAVADDPARLRGCHVPAPAAQRRGAQAAPPSATWQEQSLWYYGRCGSIAWYADAAAAAQLQLRYDSSGEHRRCRACTQAARVMLASSVRQKFVSQIPPLVGQATICGEIISIDRLCGFVKPLVPGLHSAY